MRFLKLFLLTLFLGGIVLISNTFAQEDRWVLITYDDQNNNYYLDKKSIETTKDYAKFWVKVIPTIKDSIEYEIFKWELFFKTKILCEKEYYSYFSSGNYKTYKLNDCYEVVPDSIGEMFFEYLKAYYIK